VKTTEMIADIHILTNVTRIQSHVGERVCV